MEIKKAANYNSKIFTNRRNTTFKIPQKWDVIVNHITEGYMPGTLSWLENTEKDPNSDRFVAEVSCHYIVTRSGEIYQLADLQHGTWHAVKRSPSARIVQLRSAPPNLYSVGIEHEGMHKETQGRLTAPQYQATLELHKHIIEQYESTFKEPFVINRDHIIGHYEADTVNRSKSDPGLAFPWEKLMTDLINWNKKRKEEEVKMEEKKELDTAQQWAVTNGIAADRNWDEPISKSTLIWVLFDFWKKFIKK
ncbi:N-acetylmuramoyl-L-alanine amidase [anaerobic digester metagenome]